MTLLAGTGYSRERVRPGQVMTKPGYYFTIDETRSVAQKLDLADADAMENASLKRQVALHKQEEALFQREVELEKRTAGIYERESKLNADLLKKSEKSRRGGRGFFQKLFRTIGEVVVIGVAVDAIR